MEKDKGFDPRYSGNQGAVEIAVMFHNMGPAKACEYVLDNIANVNADLLESYNKVPKFY